MMCANVLRHPPADPGAHRFGSLNRAHSLAVAPSQNGTSVVVQMSAAVRGQVTMRVAQAVDGMP